LLRHPVVGAAVEIFLPSPFVLERHELVEVGTAVDHAFLVDRYTFGGAGEFGSTFAGVERVYGGFGLGHRVVADRRGWREARRRGVQRFDFAGLGNGLNRSGRCRRSDWRCYSGRSRGNRSGCGFGFLNTGAGCGIGSGAGGGGRRVVGVEFIPAEHDFFLFRFFRHSSAPWVLSLRWLWSAAVPVALPSPGSNRPRYRPPIYWQASQSGLSMEQAFGTSAGPALRASSPVADPLVRVPGARGLSSRPRAPPARG